MGTVWRAEHSETGARVALKTVDVPSEWSLGGIRREIHALAHARHPGIVRITDQGLHEGMPWYAMELVEGTALYRYFDAPPGDEVTRVLANRGAPALARRRPRKTMVSMANSEPAMGGDQSRQPVRIGLAITLIRRLCSPLAYLHGEGIVHGDLKPENILVRPNGIPVIIDFGLSCWFAGKTGRDALDVEGAIGGTVAYIAPEQIQGGLLDARVDLYALGCILYELLTGMPPFLGKSESEILRAHLCAEPPPPSRRVAGIPTVLDELVLRLLAKRPRDRLGYADVLATALGNLGAAAAPIVRGAADTLPPAPRAYLYRPGLFGRSEELASFRVHLDRLDGGHGGLVLLGGESGIGKTRLAMEIAREALNRQLLVLGSEHGGGGGHALQAFRKPLRMIADRCRERGREETDRVLGRRGKVLAMFEPTLANLPGQDSFPAPAELPGAAARLRVLAFLAETLAAVAADSPALLVLDDLQDADELSLGFLAYASRSDYFSHTALLVLGTYRREETTAGLAGLLAMAGTVSIDLKRLGDKAVAGLVGEMLAMSSAPPRFAAFLAQESEGNPFFVAEYLRTAVDEKLIWRDERGAWQVARPGTGTAAEASYGTLLLPRALRNLVARRLASLPAMALALVEAAAVVGREAALLVLRHVADLADDDLMSAMEDLSRRQVLESGERGCARFVHGKIREVAYARIAQDRLADLHRRAAEAIEKVYAEARQEHLAELGRHWRVAGDKEKARACYLGAARRARDQWAMATAVPLYEAYLELAEGAATEESIEARRELGHSALLVLGRLEEARTVLQRALDDARKIGDGQRQGVLLRDVAHLYQLRGQPEMAQHILKMALTMHPQERDQRNEGMTLNSLGVCSTEQGRLDEARDLYERALAMHRGTRDWQSEAVVLGNLAVVRAHQGQMAAARELYEQALAIFRDAGDRTSNEGTVLGNLGMLYYYQGLKAAAHETLERSLAIARGLGDRDGEGYALVCLAMLHQHDGRMPVARELNEQALAIAREVGSRRCEGSSRRRMRRWSRRLPSTVRSESREARRAGWVTLPTGAAWRWVTSMPHTSTRRMRHPAYGSMAPGLSS
ncbi:MAG: tetratricopeptide repeat protein [Candidatus Schekmanbacteria bacterium]|nr:tetratricopeptide repeat protein [Candidatus Schekmanbacteria bacterium]